MIAILVSLANGYLYNRKFFISTYLRLLVIAICTALWGIALRGLLSRIKNVDKLLPNANMFRLHWFILVGQLIFYVLYTACCRAADNYENGSDANLRLESWTNIVGMPLCVLESSGF